jgi:hypothetical protein
MYLSSMTKKALLILSLVMIAFSCKIEEGAGGKAEITGVVMAQKRYSNAILGIKDSVIAQYPAVDERVYLTYGSNSVYDDRFDTDQNGAFKFTGLTKGDYTLTTYGYCDTCLTKINVIVKQVNLAKHKTKLTQDTIFIRVK